MSDENKYSIVVPEGYVLLTEGEYQELLDECDFLDALRKNGVDNWEWYDEAVNDYQEGRDE